MFSLPDYLDFLIRFVEGLNPHFIIERFAGETPPRYLLTKSWGVRNYEILQNLEKRMEEQNVWQGKKWEGNTARVIHKKSLHDMTTEELGQLFPVVVKDYSDRWPDLYISEAKLITGSFSPTEIVKIDHIGSTAIPGLKAKPTIDILLQVAGQINIQKIKNVFASLNYHINEHPENPPPHLTFVKGYTARGFKGQAYHVHVRYKGDWDEIRFRDYLINHVEVAKEYESLKLELADKYKNNRGKYTGLKTEFIQRVNILARK